MRFAASFAAGLLFSIGLTISGMTNPAKVRNFLDLGPLWDPSLIFVMIGASAVAFIGFRTVTRRERPLFGDRFNLPVANRIDPRLIVGACIFGIGWGLSGLCPGPAVAGLVWGRWELFAFVAAAMAGMAVADQVSAPHGDQGENVAVNAP